MDEHSSAMRTLARQLLAQEVATGRGGGEGAGKSGEVRGEAGVETVCEKLRLVLSQFAGAEGFSSLLRRALVMARDNVPALRTIKIGPGGILEGLEGLEQSESEAGAMEITANLLNLLALFIGEPLTVQLVREVWPELPHSPASPVSPPSDPSAPVPPDPQNEARPT